MTSAYESMWDEPELAGTVPMYPAKDSVLRRERPISLLPDRELALAIDSSDNWTMIVTLSGDVGWVLNADLRRV